MSPLKKPKDLNKICQDAVKRILIEALDEVVQDEEYCLTSGGSYVESYEDEITRRDKHLERIRPVKCHLLDWLMPDMASQILQLILKDDLLHPDTRIFAFQTLFTEHSKQLSFVGSYHEHYHRYITQHLIDIASKSPKIEVR